MSNETIEELRQENRELRNRVEILESKYEELAEKYEKIFAKKGKESKQDDEEVSDDDTNVETKDAKAIIVGLDAAGKTTILYQYKTGEVVTTVPTEEYNMDTVLHKNVRFQVWDLCGKNSDSWEDYYFGTDAVIFVVDSNDEERIQDARIALKNVLIDDSLEDSVLLVVANKQDLPNAKSPIELTDLLGLERTRQKWFVQPSSAVEGMGLKEGLDWVVRNIN